MNRIIKRTFLPMSGMALGFAALGNASAAMFPFLKPICGIISAVLMVLIIIKIFSDLKGFMEELKNPIVVTSFATFDMALMVLCTYTAASLNQLSFILWCLGIIMHFIILAYVTYAFILKFDIKKIFASFFIVYVGFVVASVTAPAFSMQGIGQILFYIGLLLYAVSLPVILYRIFKTDGIPEPARPTNAIIAAPASLLLAGCLNSFPAVNGTLTAILLAVALIMTLMGYYFFIKTNGKNFFPSYAAYTFPFVISALALNRTATYAVNASWGIAGLLGILGKIELLIAIASCFYVLIRYLSKYASKE